MKKEYILVFVLAVVLAGTTLIGCSPKDRPPKESQAGQPSELLVSAAASLTDVLEELKVMYKKIEPATTLTFTLGSSGALQAQIEEGAPVDVFISAAEKQMDTLEEGGHLLDTSRKTLLVNKVVLIRPKDSNLDIRSFDDISNADVKKIGVGDPANVPVGQYSEKIFNNLGIKDSITDKLVLGSDVRTVLTWVETGDVDLGLVYATDAMSSDKVTIVTEAPKGSHKEVTYPAAVIKDSNNIEAGKAFLDFLSSDQAAEVFQKYGFTIK